jgi:hypothetical protein
MDICFNSKSALDGLEGGASVSNGFSGSREISAATHVPEAITRDKMVEALKEAGTFRGIQESVPVKCK